MSDKNQKMPEPTTMNYDQQIRLSQQFVDDIMTILNEQPYYEVHDMVKTIMSSGYVMYIAPLNEIISKVSKYPYRLVHNFMDVIENNQSVYFSQIVENKTNDVDKKPTK